MKYLLTICPHCRARFYVEVSSEPTLSVTCPYCRAYYHDRTDLGNIKEADYSWELYRDIYPKPDRRLGDKKLLKASGVVILGAIAFLLIPLLYLLIDIEYFSGSDASFTSGMAFASLIFLAIMFAGALSSLNSYSFAISLTGAIFAIINSVLVGLLMSFRTDMNGYCFSMFVPMFVALIAIFIILKNKKAFSMGY